MSDYSEAKRTLVIVDDEPALRLLLKEFFKKTFNTIVLDDGSTCLEWLAHHPLPDAIILDLDMPHTTGHEVISQVRSDDRYADVPILVLSGKESSRDRVVCLRAGADDFVVKPFNPEELEARIYSILRRVNALR